MSAPRSRRLRNQSAPNTRTRRELLTAIGGVAGVLLSTAVLVWAMRPGNFNPGTGGIIHRQPRVTLWLAATVIALATAVWMVLRPDAKVREPVRTLAISAGGVVVVAVVVMATWHSSLLRDYTPPPTLPPLTTTSAPAATSTTTPGVTTTVPPGATTTVPGATTTVPGAATTTVAGATTSTSG